MECLIRISLFLLQRKPGLGCNTSLSNSLLRGHTHQACHISHPLHRSKLPIHHRTQWMHGGISLGNLRAFGKIAMVLVDVVIGLSQKLSGRLLDEDTVNTSHLTTLASSLEPPLDYPSFSISKMLIRVNPKSLPCKVDRREASDLQVHSFYDLSFVGIIEQLG